MMKSIIAAVSAALALSVATVGAAEAGNWTARWTGPRGGAYEGSGTCGNGACQSSGTSRGPMAGSGTTAAIRTRWRLANGRRAQHRRPRR